MSSFYVASGALVEIEDGELLMVQEGKEHIKGTWDFPGGGFEHGESILNCVKREILEETGYKVEITSIFGILKELNQRDKTETVSFRFKGKTVERKPEKMKDDNEILDVKFFSPEEIRELDLRAENRLKVLEKYQEGKEYPLDLLMDKLNLI